MHRQGHRAHTITATRSSTYVIKGGTNNSSLDLDGLARLLLGGVVVSNLLVQSSPGLGPDKLGGLLSLVKHVAALGAGQSDGLTITTDEADTVTRVNSSLAEGAQISSAMR